LAAIHVPMMEGNKQNKERERENALLFEHVTVAGTQQE